MTVAVLLLLLVAPLGSDCWRVRHDWQRLLAATPAGAVVGAAGADHPDAEVRRRCEELAGRLPGEWAAAVFLLRPGGFIDPAECGRWAEPVRRAALERLTVRLGLAGPYTPWDCPGLSEGEKVAAWANWCRGRAGVAPALPWAWSWQKLARPAAGGD